jgi:hypothetical protein
MKRFPGVDTQTDTRRRPNASYTNKPTKRTEMKCSLTRFTFANHQVLSSPSLANLVFFLFPSLFWYLSFSFYIFDFQEQRSLAQAVADEGVHPVVCGAEAA